MAEVLLPFGCNNAHPEYRPWLQTGLSCFYLSVQDEKEDLLRKQAGNFQLALQILFLIL